MVVFSLIQGRWLQRLSLTALNSLMNFVWYALTWKGFYFFCSVNNIWLFRNQANIGCWKALLVILRNQSKLLFKLWYYLPLLKVCIKKDDKRCCFYVWFKYSIISAFFFSLLFPLSFEHLRSIMSFVKEKSPSCSITLHISLHRGCQPLLNKMNRAFLWKWEKYIIWIPNNVVICLLSFT